MITVKNSFFKDYQDLLIKNDSLSQENRTLRYSKIVLENKNKTLRNNEEKYKIEIENKNKEIEDKNKEIKDKDNEIARLKALLNMDGTNHGIPTSQTPINKKKIIPNTREKSGNKKGGQAGHKKHKLEKFNNNEVTEIMEHRMETCPYCNSHAIEETGKEKEKDEFDYKIAPIKRRHKFIEYRCNDCGRIFHQTIPNELKEENQYGPEVQALALTLMNQANVTINKTQKIIYGMTNREIDLSEGYIAKLQKRAATRLSNFMKEMKLEIIKQPVLHWDDTVIMVNTNRSCLRFYGTEKLALYKAHDHKNKEGLDEDGILKCLPKETTVEHDHNKVNYNDDYSFKNAECNVHLIRDLAKVVQNLNHTWAKELIDLISKMNDKRKLLIKDGKEEFEQEEINQFEDKFKEIMSEALKQNQEESQKYYVDTENTLILRIFDYKHEYFLWIYNFDIPFDNNLSERGLRGIKSKQKASGQFWNINSASWYATIKTYVETCNRNGVNVYNALIRLSTGHPYSLKEILNGEID